MMDTSSEFIVASQFKDLAESKFQTGDLSDACFCYINCLKVLPEWKNELKSRFLLVLSYLGQFLESQKQFNEIFVIYEEALKLYSDCEEIHHNLGAHLLRLGHPSKAAIYFKEALKYNANYFPARRSLHSAYCALVERWHYRMLNDSVRNECYRNAIVRKINQGFNTILDIGTGTGLFCLYALDGGAGRIYGCDHNSVMISIASRVLSERDSISSEVKLLEKNSNEIVIPYDIPERVSLVITETMDSCMLGEHLLQTLKYAWQNLLHPPYNFTSNMPALNSQPSGMVIPYSGSLWFSVLQSRQLARKYMFPLTDIDMDECAHALANVSLQDDIPENFQPLVLENIEISVELDEPYDTERLQMLSDCTFLSEPRELLYVNFNDPDQIEKCLQCENRSSFDVTCTVDGYFHAIAAWFRVQLDEDTVLCSAPDDSNAKNCCWDQAVFPCHRVYRVVPGCRISILSDWTDGKVTFQVQQIAYPNGLTQIMLSESMKASSSIVSMLNDANLLLNLRRTAIKFLNDFRGERELRIMDTFPVPICGLTLLRNIHLTNRSLDHVQLVCVINAVDDARIIEKIAECNQIPSTCLSFILLDDFDEQLTQTSSEYFDAIILNFLDSEGDLSESTVSRIGMLKSLLKKDGVFVPKKVEICSQLVHSDYIEENMRVVDGDVHRLGIGEAINEFQVSQMVEMNLSLLNFEKYSSTFTSHQFSIDQFDSEFSKEFFVTVCREGSINAITYWFNVYFSDDDRSYSTLEEFSYVHQAAFITKSPIVFQKNENAVVQFIYHHGIFSITLLKNDDNFSL